MLLSSIREINQQGKTHGLSWFATELISHGAIHRVSYSCPETSEGSKWGYLFSPYMFLERKQGIKIENNYKVCKWCYKSYKVTNKDNHKICESKSKIALRSRRQNLNLVNSRVDKFSSPMHNQNKYLSEDKNMEILLAYYEMGWLKKDPRSQF
jgi:hypothetical protein